ncbi:protein-L-isoaspartate(D-aspartate) O-methyltransferase [Sorangium sp. So ce302]|uniref:protein-L-isoaspartate(D-aspartate) O-methyltransferase n=1 Tax=Sorangium sp. So ce302 TaxID=3133297 RepID=UPI003F6124ED
MTRGGLPASSDDLVRSVRAAGVADDRALEALGSVPRALFVPPDRVAHAYEDIPIPIGHGQVTTQPSLLARMVQALRLDGTERVLEVGTGLGFQAAILARLCREVFTIERVPDLVERAAWNLWRAGISSVTVCFGDGTVGLPRHAPYDAIVTSAAAPAGPRPLVEQLAEGGRLVHPLGPSGFEMVVAYRKRGRRLVEEAHLGPASFVPMVGSRDLPAG